MPTERWSLLAGRNQAPLTPKEVLRASNTLLGLESAVVTRYDPDARTVFRINRETPDEEYGEIVFGPDIYPGRSVVDPNAALSLRAAAAHELTHYHRWMDLTALPQDSFEHIDEALTSLQAVMRYDRHLGEHDVRQLISDAIQRLQLYLQGLEAKK